MAEINGVVKRLLEIRLRMHFPETDQSEHSTWTERFTKRVTDIRARYENTIRELRTQWK